MWNNYAHVSRFQSRSPIVSMALSTGGRVSVGSSVDWGSLSDGLHFQLGERSLLDGLHCRQGEGSPSRPTAVAKDT